MGANPKPAGQAVSRLTNRLKPERQSEALDLRYKGYSYKQIATEMKISETRAYQLVKNAMSTYATVLEDEAKHIRETQYGRLEDLLKKTHEIYTATNDLEIKLKAIARAESIIMYQAKLYGVDVTRIEAVVKAPWQTLLADVVVINDEIGPAPEDANVIDAEAEEDDDIGDP